MEKVGFFTKYHSNRNYINEIPVEGKHTSRFYFQIAHYDEYIIQVIRAGNGLSLFSNKIELNRDNFWNPHYFEDTVRYVFWTFHNSFLLVLEERILNLSSVTVTRFLELLKANPIAYKIDLLKNHDPELYWCTVKNSWLIKNPKISRLHELDKENRAILLAALQNRANYFKDIADEKKKKGITHTTITLAPPEISFLSILEPINESPQETLEFIIEQVAKAGLEFDVFSTVPKLHNGKNPYGFNSCIGAVIDHFYSLGYFKTDCSLETIFKAYSNFSGNSIGKLKIFISEFRQEKNYLKNTAKLKLLKIKKLR